MQNPSTEQQAEILADSLMPGDDDNEFYQSIRGTLSNEEFNKMHDDLMSHPLFMKEMPENIEDNPQLSALQHILYDDSAENLAEHFNAKGNELYKKGPDKKYFLKEALKTYTEGIDAKGADNEINAKLYNNRALIQIKFKNFGKAIQDCQEAIKYNPSFTKAYFRCAQAYNFLFKFKDSIEILEKGIKACEGTKELQDLKKKTLQQYENQMKKEKIQKEEKSDLQSKLFKICNNKKITLGKSNMDFPDQCRKCIFLEEDLTIKFPLFVSFLEFQTMDYIDGIPENNSLYLHLQEVIGDQLTYDKQNIYNIDNLEVYIELNATLPLQYDSNSKSWPNQKGLVKVDYKQTMLYIMQTPGYVNKNLIMFNEYFSLLFIQFLQYLFIMVTYILPMVPEILVVCPDSKAFYNDYFLKNYEIIK